MTMWIACRASALVTVFGLALVHPGAAAAQDEKLGIGTWGGSWRDSIEENIVSELGEDVTVEYVLGNPADNLAKIIAAKRQGQVPFDAMEGSPELYDSMVKADLLAPLNYNNIPNADALPEWARQEHQVVGLLVEDGIAYNVEKFEEAGIKPPESYMDLADPRLEGHVAFPDISHVQHWNAAVGLALERGGDEANMQPAIEGVNEISPDFFYSSSTDLASRFSSGDIWAAPWHAGWVVRLARTGVPISISYPKFGEETGALWGVPQHVVAGTEKSELAERFVNAYLDPQAQYAHAVGTGSVPVLSEARQRMIDEGKGTDFLFLRDEEIADAFMIDWGQLDTESWREKWSREVAR